MPPCAAVRSFHGLSKLRRMGHGALHHCATRIPGQLTDIPREVKVAPQFGTPKTAAVSALSRHPPATRSLRSAGSRTPLSRFHVKQRWRRRVRSVSARRASARSIQSARRAPLDASGRKRQTHGRISARARNRGLVVGRRRFLGTGRFRRLAAEIGVDVGSAVTPAKASESRASRLANPDAHGSRRSHTRASSQPARPSVRLAANSATSRVARDTACCIATFDYGAAKRKTEAPAEPFNAALVFQAAARREARPPMAIARPHIPKWRCTSRALNQRRTKSWLLAAIAAWVLLCRISYYVLAPELGSVRKAGRKGSAAIPACVRT